VPQVVEFDGKLHRSNQVGPDPVAPPTDHSCRGAPGAGYNQVSSHTGPGSTCSLGLQLPEPAALPAPA
jgi:hypothetical protein